MLKNMSEIRKFQKSWKRKTVYRRRVNELLKKTKSKDVTEDNGLFYPETALVTKVFKKT